MHLVAEPGAEVRELLGRQVVVGIEFARLEALDRGRAVLGGIEVHRIELHAVRIMELRVPDDLDVVVRHPFGEREGAVRDEIAGLRPCRAEFFHGGAMHRIGRLMRQHLEEVRRRRVERDFERLADRRRARRSPPASPFPN